MRAGNRLGGRSLDGRWADVGEFRGYGISIVEQYVVNVAYKLDILKIITNGTLCTLFKVH